VEVLVRSHQWLRVAGAAAAVTVVVSVAGLAGSSWANASGSQGAAADDDDQSIIEDYSYPDAAAILAASNVEVIAGDGHILVADCASPPVGDIGLINVYTTAPVGNNKGGRVCFQVSGSVGWLKLKVPGVYEIRGDGQKTGTGHVGTADIQPEGGQQKSVPLAPSSSVQVGVSGNPPGPPTTLLELRASGLAKP
jgi:hypothetical protein